jgi:hypothetical protein
MTMARRIDTEFQSCRTQLIDELERTCQTIALSSIEARVLQKWQPQKQHLSDLDRYFADGVVMIDESGAKGKNWLLSWWRTHSDEYPRMAAAARDYLAIPASGVSVERLFNSGRDLLGLRRSSLSGETMRRLVLLRDVYKSEDVSTI